MTLGVVTISFNQARFLQDAISSVTLTHPKLLSYAIVDPGSKDESREIIEQNKDKFAAIILEPDKGPADGLNKGFQALKSSEILAYLNADDRFHPGALDFALDFFENHPNTDILLGSILVINESGRPDLRGRSVNKVTPSRFAIGTAGIWQQATFFRRAAFEKVGGFNPQNRISWDSELVVDMLLAGATVGYTKKVLGEFRLYPTSITGTLKEKRWHEYQSNQRRIQDKIWAAGHAKTPKQISSALRLLDKYNPARHLRNLAIGITARSSNSRTPHLA